MGRVDQAERAEEAELNAARYAAIAAERAAIREQDAAVKAMLPLVRQQAASIRAARDAGIGARKIAEALQSAGISGQVDHIMIAVGRVA